MGGHVQAAQPKSSQRRDAMDEGKYWVNASKIAMKTKFLREQFEGYRETLVKTRPKKLIVFGTYQRKELLTTGLTDKATEKGLMEGTALPGEKFLGELLQLLRDLLVDRGITDDKVPPIPEEGGVLTISTK